MCVCVSVKGESVVREWVTYGRQGKEATSNNDGRNCSAQHSKYDNRTNVLEEVALRVSVCVCE